MNCNEFRARWRVTTSRKLPVQDEPSATLNGRRDNHVLHDSVDEPISRPAAVPQGMYVAELEQAQRSRWTWFGDMCEKASVPQRNRL